MKGCGDISTCPVQGLQWQPVQPHSQASPHHSGCIVVIACRHIIADWQWLQVEKHTAPRYAQLGSRLLLSIPLLDWSPLSWHVCVCGSECRLDLCGTGERRTNSSLDWLPMSALPEELPGARPEGHAHVQPDVFGMFSASASPCGSFQETERERAVDSMICFFHRPLGNNALTFPLILNKLSLFVACC